MKLISPPQFLHKQLTSAKTGENYSLSAVLSTALESKDFFIHHEILQPGRRASAPHTHADTEEIVIVIKGEATIYEGGTSVKGGPGALACFHAGGSNLHYVANESGSDIEMMVISKGQRPN